MIRFPRGFAFPRNDPRRHRSRSASPFSDRRDCDELLAHKTGDRMKPFSRGYDLVDNHLRQTAMNPRKGAGIRANREQMLVAVEATVESGLIPLPTA